MRKGEETPVRLASLAEVPFEEYAAAARRFYGERSYVASERFVSWLYDELPVPGVSRRDGVVAVHEDRVVGCFHRFALPVRKGEATLRMTILSNLFVDEEYRGRGLARRLAEATVAGSKNVFMTGTVPASTRIFRSMGYDVVEAGWYRKPVLSVRLPLSLAAAALRLGRPRYFQRPVPLGPEHSTTCEPSGEQLRQIARRLNERPPGVWGVDWSAELVRWRFFHPAGPRHLLVTRRDVPVANGTGPLAIVSLGPRHRLNVGRVNAIAAGTPAELKALLRAARRATGRSGGAALIFYTTQEEQNRWTQEALGWKPMESPPPSLVFRDPPEPDARYAFSGAAGDVGFEAIPVP